MKKKKRKMTDRVTIRLPEAQRLDLLRTAEASARSVGYLVRQALARTYGEQALADAQTTK